MNKSTKILLKLGIIFTVLGLGLFVFAFSMADWNFENLSTTKYQENQHEIIQEFEKISINIDTADVNFEISNDKTAKVVCFERESQPHTVSVANQTLCINYDEQPWYSNITLFSFKSPKITVYLPQKAYSELLVVASTADVRITKEFTFNNISVTTSTGDITLSNITTVDTNLTVSTGEVKLNKINCKNDLKIAVSTGDTEIYDSQCGNLISSGSTGDLDLINVIASGKFTIERSTGDVEIEASDASEIAIMTDTGDVTATLLSSKIFSIFTDTGRINVPISLEGGLCQVTTDTGDIKISIKN